MCLCVNGVEGKGVESEITLLFGILFVVTVLRSKLAGFGAVDFQLNCSFTVLVCCLSPDTPILLWKTDKLIRAKKSYRK